MSSVLPGTIEQLGVDKYKVGTLKAPSGGAWFALEAVLFAQHWLDGRREPHWLRARELNVIKWPHFEEDSFLKR